MRMPKFGLITGGFPVCEMLMERVRKIAGQGPCFDCIHSS